MRKVIDTLLYIWQLPQNLLGLAVIFLSGAVTGKYDAYKDSGLWFVRQFGGVSLGRYIIIHVNHATNMDTIKHEYGHCRQSKRWGPLYLFVPGLVSLMHNLFCNCGNHKHSSYYNIWPENEADRLGNVKRN